MQVSSASTPTSNSPTCARGPVVGAPLLDGVPSLSFAEETVVRIGKLRFHFASGSSIRTKNQVCVFSLPKWTSTWVSSLVRL